jgi:sulfite reductase alpha subunit-like flavoprotein
MIANGSGIAPFRSIVQYVATLEPNRRIPMKLYFGIQNR